MSLDRAQVHKQVFDDALFVLNNGAPGLSKQSREVVARAIAIRASHHLADKLRQTEAVGK